MNKRYEFRAQRRKKQARSRLQVILLGVAGSLLVACAFILPSINRNNPDPGTTMTPIVTVAPRVINAPVDGPRLGNPDATVKVDVWEDFQCPSCLNYSKTIEPEVIRNYVETGKILYTFHFFPFIETFASPPTQESHQAANAAMCASEQGRFWDYHEILYANWAGENQGGYADTRLVAMASALQLNMNDFNKCFQEKRYKAQIDQDFADGQAWGVQGTPSVFVNGTLLTPGYVPSYDQIAQAIEAGLAGR